MLVQAAPAPPQNQIDPLLVLMMQQSAMDNNVVADAEFDPPVIGLGEYATYRIVVTALSEAVTLPEKLPAPAGLELRAGGRGMSFAPIGQTTQSRTTFNFHVTAKAEGSYAMPAFNAVANGKPVMIPATQLQVVAPGTGPSLKSPRLLAEIAPGDVYVGQALTVQVTLLDPNNTTVQGMLQPQAVGDAFIFEQSPGRQRREYRNVGGVTFPAMVNEIVVIPIKEGQHTLTVQAFAYLNRASAQRMISLPMYNPLLDSEPITVSVQHLPKTGELPGFTGLIGAFQVDLPRLSTNQLRAGDPLAMMITVKGVGNLTRLVPPRLEHADQWQVFPPVPDLTPPFVIQQRGSYNFAVTMIPLSEQVQATPPIPFSYFDPYRKRYVDISVVSVPVKVTAAPRLAATTTQTNEPGTSFPEDNGQRAERGQVMTGITDRPGPAIGSLVPVQARGWFLGLQLLPAAALGGLVAWDRRRRFLEQHPEVILKQRARRGVRHQLRRARRAAAGQDVAGFVAAAVDALREACAPHSAANPQALVCADVLAELPATQRAGTGAEMVTMLFEAADASHFMNQTPNRAALLTLSPRLEQLLGELGKRL